VSPPAEAPQPGETTRRKPRRPPRLRPATFDDYAQIDALGSRYGLKPKGYEEWSNLWSGNPAYREVHAAWSIGWVLEDEHRRIVGSVGNIPVWYELDGKRLLAASSHSWVADLEYRGAALLLLDRLINQPGVDLFVTTTNSAASTPGVEAFQCKHVPVGIWDESAFWITAHRGFAESFLRLRNNPLARPLSYPLSVAAWLRDRLTPRRAGGPDVEVTPCAGFDERFDDFWAALRQNHPETLLCVRTREVLEWHYRSLLLSDRLWIATVGDGARLVAYAVFDRSDKPAVGLKRIRLIDYQSLDGSPAFVQPLLAWALERCRAQGIHMLEYFGRWLEPGQAVDVLAPHRRRLPTWIFAYRAGDPALARRLDDPRVWAPTLSDGDASLVR
jgi:hypothetical protein